MSQRLKAKTAKLNAMKAELKRLLAQPLVARGVSTKYITSGSRCLMSSARVGSCFFGVRRALRRGMGRCLGWERDGREGMDRMRGEWGRGGEGEGEGVGKKVNQYPFLNTLQH